jgi:hypothetical protein
MLTLAKAAIPGSVLWPLLLGTAVTLVSTVLAQWASLTSQTRRQREVRRADFQRATLLALQQLLGDVDDAARRAKNARWEALRQTGKWDAEDNWTHSNMEALRSLTYRLRLLATGLEDKQLRDTVEQISHLTWLDATAREEDVVPNIQEQLWRSEIEAARLLGEQLRSLP